MTTSLNALPLTKVLIHNDYGAYGGFSEEFYQEFTQTYGIDFNTLPSYDPSFDKKNKNEDISSRYDPRLIHIFEKLGKDRTIEKIPERPYRKSSMIIEEIPTALLDAFYISEYDGAEWIWCNISKKYKDVLFDAVQNHKKMADIQDQLNEIAQCEEFLTANEILFV